MNHESSGKSAEGKVERLFVIKIKLIDNWVKSAEGKIDPIAGEVESMKVDPSWLTVNRKMYDLGHAKAFHQVMGCGLLTA